MDRQVELETGSGGNPKEEEINKEGEFQICMKFPLTLSADY